MSLGDQPGPPQASRDPCSCHVLLPPGPWDVPSAPGWSLTRLPCAVLSCVRYETWDLPLSRMRRMTGMRATCSPTLTRYSGCSKDTIPLAARGPGQSEGPNLSPFSTPTLPLAQPNLDSRSLSTPTPPLWGGRGRGWNIFPEKVEVARTVSNRHPGRVRAGKGSQVGAQPEMRP